MSEKYFGAMKNFVEDNTFIMLIAMILEGLPPKVSKKFFDAAELSGACYYSSSFYMDRFLIFRFHGTIIPHRVAWEMRELLLSTLN